MSSKLAIKMTDKYTKGQTTEQSQLPAGQENQLGELMNPELLLDSSTHNTNA